MSRVIVLVFIFSSFIFAKNVRINLDEAISLALENNGLNKISKINLEIADAQYQQALSANFPSLDAVLYANRNNRDLISKQRGTYDLSNEETAGLIKTLTGNEVPSSAVTPLTLPADIDSKAAGRDTVKGSLEMNYALYTGGKIDAIIQQAKLNKELAKIAIIRSESDVIFDVKKYYYGYILTNELHKIVDKIYKNMKFSTDLAKEFLESSSSLKINRTDYLNAKLTTSLIQSTLSKLELNRELLKNAMGNLIGLEWNDKVEISYEEKEILNQNVPLQKIIKKAYESNPDISQINLAVKIKDEQINEAQSAYYPQVGVFGSVNRTYNSYEYGYLNEENKDTWNIGIAIKMSLFDGFRTSNNVLEKKLNKKVINEQKILLENAIALQLKNEFLSSTLAYKQINILNEAVEIASENSELNLKGFEYEMVEAKDLIQSQLTEAYVKADYFKNVHDYLLSLAAIDKLVGQKINENF
ncbi:MAG: TolC family protein [Aliarcobacter sp.]|jgi:outer membrane protein TolC|nr:TolC family protein [Aliarcobacter sp.]